MTSTTPDNETAARGRRLLPVLLILSCLFWLSAAPAERPASLKRFEYRQVHMGLQVRLLLYAPAKNDAFQAASEAFREIARLDSILSDYRADSELMRLVARAGTGPVPIGDDLFQVLQHAQRIAHRTGGAFDVTVSPYVRLWREARRTATLPDSTALAHARGLVGYQGLVLDTVNQTAAVQSAGMQLDVGGIAKGYAADRALAVLNHLGIDRALIAFGGDVRVGAPPPGEAAWRVEVDHADSLHRYIEIAQAAVASSGDTEQFVEIDGVRYSHVVDPATGLGLTTRVAATVVAPIGITADALATALTILPPDEVNALLEEHYPNVTAYVRRVTGDGRTVYSTARTR